MSSASSEVVVAEAPRDQVDPTATVPPRAHGLSVRGWLWLHCKIGLLTFGTGSVFPIYERALVRDAKALSNEQFQQALTIAQVLPGPSLVTFCAYLGGTLFGPLVAVLGVLAMCFPGALWALLVIEAVPIHRLDVQAVFHGFAVGALVLLVDLVRRLARGLTASDRDGVPVSNGRVARRWLVALAVGALVLLRVPMAHIAGIGVVACLVAEFVA